MNICLRKKHKQYKSTKGENSELPTSPLLFPSYSPIKLLVDPSIFLFDKNFEIMNESLHFSI